MDAHALSATTVARGLMVLAVPLLVLSLTPAAASAAELVTFPSGTDIDAPADLAGQVEIAVPMVAGDLISLADLQGEYLETRRGSAVYEPPSGDPAVSVGEATQDLRITVNLDDFPHGGAVYTLVVSLSGSDGETQIVGLTLTRPASTLTAEPADVGVTQTVIVPELGLTASSSLVSWLPSSLLDEERKPQLRLQVGPEGRLHELSSLVDTSGDAASVNVKCAKDGNPDDELVPCVFDPVKMPQSRIELGYQLEGTFQLGSQTRTVSIESPQLAAPVQVTFTVLTKRSAVLIPALLLAGILVGWLLRTVLTKMRDVSRARTARDQLILRLRGLAAGSADSELKAALDALADELRDQSAWRSQKTLKKVEGIHDQAKALLDTHAASLKTLAEHADRWQALATQRALPAKVAEQIQPARAKYLSAVALIATADATGAKTALDSLDALGSDARANSRDWVTDYGESAGSLIERIDQASAEARLPEDVRAAFGRLKKETSDAKAASAIGGAAQGSAPSIAQVLDAASDVALRHPDVVTATNEVARTVNNHSPAASRQIIAALDVDDERRQLDALNSTLVAAAEQIVRDTEFARHDKLEGVSPPVAAGETPKTETVDELPHAPAPLFDRLVLLPGGLLYSGLGWFAAAMKFVLLVVLATIVGFATWHGDWVGTATDMIGVFAFGFALDLTTDAVAQALTGIKTPT